MKRRPTPEVPPTLDPSSQAAQQTAAPVVGPGETATLDLPRVGAGFIAVYGFTYFGFYLVLFMPSLFSLAYKIALIDEAGKEAHLGVIVGVGSLVSLLLGPVFGVLSDGTRMRWGRRRPFLVTGLVLAALSAVWIAVSPNIPMILVGWLVAQAATSSISAALNPTLPEYVPPAQRGKLGALGGVATSIAGVSATLVGSFLTGNLLLLFLVPVAVFAVGVVLWLFVMPDAPAPPTIAKTSVWAALRALVFNPLKYPDFSWVWIGKLFLNIGIAFFSTFQLYVLIDRLGFTAETAGRQLAVVGGISLLATMLFTIAGGWLSDKLGRRKPFLYVASSLVAAGAIIAGFAPDFLVYAIGGTLLAAGTGAFNSVDLALAADVLPNEKEGGKWMSIYFLSGSLASAVGPIVAPLVLAVGSGGANYTALFVSGGAIALGAAITASRVRGAR